MILCHSLIAFQMHLCRYATVFREIHHDLIGQCARRSSLPMPLNQTRSLLVQLVLDERLNHSDFRLIGLPVLPRVHYRLGKNDRRAESPSIGPELPLESVEPHQ